jgi:hypothetical protein
MEVLTRKRSSWASGSLYVPACSMGFWVAITRKGLPTSCAWPSTVTRDSSMTSSSADCVFGEARLISSASTIDANTGPRWNSNAPVFWS